MASTSEHFLYSSTKIETRDLPVQTSHGCPSSSKRKATMVLQLHVWGPAFSLPSIDAQCLAIIAYCSEVLPKGSWELVATSDPSVSPTGK